MSNAPQNALDVWLRFNGSDEESEAEANTYPDGDRYRVDWYLTAVGLVTSVWFDTYAESQAWLENQGFEDFTVLDDDEGVQR